MTRPTLIAACAPIPTDDLTADQIAGPYLEADVYARLLSQAGIRAHYALGTDDYHSQVDVRAHQLRCAADGVIDPARGSIRRSLQAYSIEPDHFGWRDADCQAFVRSFFAGLCAAGMLEVRAVDVLRDIKSGAYPTDAWVRGSCPSCLDATAGGSCESCGTPNTSLDLLGLDPQRYSVRARPRLILDLERFRPELERNLSRLRFQRPGLARLIRSQLEKPLTPFVLSTEGGRGPALDFAGLPDQRLHASAEVYAAQLYFLQRAAGELSASDEYFQFAPLGCAYTHAFVHGALACAAASCGNEQPTLGALLTSRLQPVRPNRGARNLIWARELSDVYSADALRLYLALSGPEHSESQFVRRVMDSSIEHLSGSIERLVQIWNQQRHQPDANRAPQPPRDVIECMQRSTPLADYSTAELAQRALNCIDHFAHKAGRPRAGLARFIPSLLVLSLEPFCPDYARAVRERFPEAATRWASLTTSPVAYDLPHWQSRPRASAPDVTVTSIVTEPVTEVFCR